MEGDEWLGGEELDLRYGRIQARHSVAALGASPAHRRFFICPSEHKTRPKAHTVYPFLGLGFKYTRQMCTHACVKKITEDAFM